MAYRFGRDDKSVEQAIRRIARQQIAKALDSIDEGEQAEAVHDVRKRCKKLRALVRLVRPRFADYAVENAAFRDAARMVSGARDTKVLHETCEALRGHSEDSDDRAMLAAIGERIAAAQRDPPGKDEVPRALDQVRQALVAAGERAERWSLDAHGWAALSEGLTASYRRARKAAAIAHERPDTEALHDLRKRIKDHWYHCRLLAPIWPDQMPGRIAAARDLADLLGLDHDLAVFAQAMAKEPDLYGVPGAVGESVGRAVTLAARRRAELEEEAWPAIERLLAQKPKALGKHWGRLWAVWQEPGAAQALPPAP